jgi:hypothetical protein
MTHSHFDTWHHNKISKACRANNMTRDSKSVNLTHFWRLSICNLFSRNTSHSHDNLRRVSKSPLLHPFACRRSGTLDWRVTKATSADSSRLIHTILAHSSTGCSLFFCTLLHLSIFQSFISIGHLEFKLLSFLSTFRPSPDKNQKIEESKNRSWVCPSPTFDFLTTIRQKSKNWRIKESKNRRIPNWSWSCDNRQMSERVSLPPSPIFYRRRRCLSSFHRVCEQITLLLRLLSPLKPSQTLT